MKIDSVLTDYFYQHQELPLPGLGTIVLVEKNNKGNAKQDEEYHFIKKVDDKSKQDLIAYVQKVTGKMASLAASDIESVVLDGKQLLNIHQPFALDGVGVLEKDQYGNIHFQPYNTHLHHQHIEEQESSGSEERIPSLNQHKYLKWLALAVAIILVAALCWFLLFAPATKNNDQPAVQSGSHTTTKKNIASTKHDNNEAPAVHSSAQGGNSFIHYRVVFETSPNPRATERYQELKSWGHHVVMEPADENGYYKLAIPFTTLPSDTTAMKDSISRQYGREVYLEIIR